MLEVSEQRKQLSDRARVEGEPVTRREQMLAEKRKIGDTSLLPEPPIDAPYIAAYLFDMGPTMPGGSGMVPLSHGEIRCWQDNIGVELQPWEIRIIRRLSKDYLVALRESQKRDCPAPWSPEARRIDRVAIAKRVRRLFRGG